MALFDQIKAIEDAIVNRLILSAIPGVNGIVYNRELRDGDLANPYLRIFPDPSPINGTLALAISEEWTFRFTIMAVAASYESADADQARELALKASSALFTDPVTQQQDRCLGGVVKDIERAIWHAEFTRELPTTKLFGAAMEMEARTILKEV